jgi:predicted amidohydrolase
MDDCLYVIYLSITYLMKPFKLALLQTRCAPDKEQNIKFISTALHEAGSKGANVSILG